ncbi:hypothetical protein HON17_05745 [bacterium]|nr:hypothetical protein [bacterium]
MPSKDKLNELYLNNATIGGFANGELEFYGVRFPHIVGSEFRQWFPAKSQ